MGILCFPTMTVTDPAGCRRGEAGGDTMIDLSYLTEEEQGVIMSVMRRDAELKKAEEERIR